MNQLPKNENELVVQSTDHEPKNKSDTRNTWVKFVDLIRTTIGLKPLYLAERYAEAKVRQEEADADAKLLWGRSQAELASAEADRIRLEAEGNHAKATAIADYIRSQTPERNKDHVIDSNLVQTILDSETKSPDEAAEDLKAVIERIKFHGGSAEIDTHEEDKES